MSITLSRSTSKWVTWVTAQISEPYIASLSLAKADVHPSAFFNDITYVRPKVPTLYSALSTGVSASNASVYGVNSNAFILKKNEVVEIVLNNNDPGRHPFHLHGHSFQTIVRSAEDAGNFVDNETFPTVPMKRDTVLVRPNGYLVLRFRADNPDKFLPPSLPLTLS